MIMIMIIIMIMIMIMIRIRIRIRIKIIVWTAAGRSMFAKDNAERAELERQRREEGLF